MSPVPALVPSPNCVAGYTCLQNGDYGVINNDIFNIDLNLELVDTENTTKAFVDARNKWMQAIDRDNLPTRQSDLFISPLDTCTNPMPQFIDDVYICGREEDIDGAGNETNIVGFAGPIFGRTGGGEPPYDFWLTITARMVFDTYDINRLVEEGTWAFVIGHEMVNIFYSITPSFFGV